MDLKKKLHVTFIIIPFYSIIYAVVSWPLASLYRY